MEDYIHNQEHSHVQTLPDLKPVTSATGVAHFLHPVHYLTKEASSGLCHVQCSDSVDEMTWQMDRERESMSVRKCEKV